VEHLDYAVSCAMSSRPWILITDCDHPEIDVERAVFAAAALGFDVVGHDAIPPDEPPVPLLSLEELLRTSDVVSLHLPLTSVTRHLIDAPRLALMRPSAVLVNTSRGGIVDQAALAEAVVSERLAGAALDVLEREPPDDGDPLLACDQVIITPHVAFYSEESLAELKRRAAQSIVEALARRAADL
jgi:D-3-phosphoglycerate dehydrogenase / 2-oxoglutarate reductase